MERSSLKRESLDNLLGGPLGSRVFGNIEVDNLSSVMGQNKEDKQHFEGCRRNDDEVDGDKVFDVSVSIAPTKPRRGGWRVEVETAQCRAPDMGPWVRRDRCIYSRQRAPASTL